MSPFFWNKNLINTNILQTVFMNDDKNLDDLSFISTVKSLECSALWSIFANPKSINAHWILRRDFWEISKGVHFGIGVLNIPASWQNNYIMH